MKDVLTACTHKQQRIQEEDWGGISPLVQYNAFKIKLLQFVSLAEQEFFLTVLVPQILIKLVAE